MSGTGVELSIQLYQAINSGSPESRFAELRQTGAQCEDTHFAAAASADDDGVLGALWNVWPESKVPEGAFDQIALSAKSRDHLARLFSAAEQRPEQLARLFPFLIDTVLPFLFSAHESLRQQTIDFLCKHGQRAEIQRQHGGEYDQYLPPNEEETEDDEEEEQAPKAEQ